MSAALVVELARALRASEEALITARLAVSEWALYASPYFQKKHGLDQDLGDLSRAIEAVREAAAKAEGGAA